MLRVRTRRLYDVFYAQTAMSEIVFTQTGDDAADRRTRRAAEAGQLRQIAPRVYTANLRDPLEEIVERNIWGILGKLFPGAVISGRSAALARPAFPTDAAGNKIRPGYVFLTGPSRRSVSLPGIEVRIARGPGALPDDMPFQGLHLASGARHLLENLSPTRERSGMARGLSREEVERFLVRQCDVAGEASLNELRDKARGLAGPMGAESAFGELDGIVGALLRTRQVALKTKGGLALASGEPIDETRLELFNLLFAHLRQTPTPRVEDRGRGSKAETSTAFIEAYFSNYIEGTRFPVGVAKSIVFDGLIPERRPKDGRDVLATFRQVATVEDMKHVPRTFEEFEAALRGRHHALMEARPEIMPGEYKTVENQAGNTLFVQPRQVRGTLRSGFELLAGLDDPFARAVFVHFLIAEVHPFSDGNGRLSRIFMTMELVRAGRARVIIPTVYRDDYLGVMRALSRHGDPTAMVRGLARAQQIGAAIVEEDVDRAIAAWATTHAFVEAGPHARLTPYDPNVTIEWKDGTPAPGTYWQAVVAEGGLPFRV